MKRTDRESNFAEKKKLLRLMQKLPDETRSLFRMQSNLARLQSVRRCKEKEGKGKRAGVVKAAAVNAHAGSALAGVELLVNQLNSGAMPGIAAVDAWGI